MTRHGARRGGSRHLGLLLLGLVGGLVWSIAVELAGPGSWDPSEACELRFDQGNYEVIKQTFPPRATCVGSRGRLAFIPPATTAVLTGFGVLLGLLTAAGLGRYVRSLFGAGVAPDAPPDRDARSSSASLRRRLAAHIAGSALLGAIMATCSPSLLLVSGIFGNYLGLWLMAGLLFVLVALCATLLDGAVGPPAGGSLASQRRGLTVAVVGLLPVVHGPLGYARLVDNLSWPWPVGSGLLFAGLTLILWLPLLRRRWRVSYRGE